MKSLWRIGSFMMVAWTVACGANLSKSAGAPETTPDALVYAAALERLFPGSQESTGRQFVISASTSPSGRNQLVEEYWTTLYGIPDVDSAMIESLQQRGGIPNDLHPIRPALDKILTPKITLISSAELREIKATASTMTAEQAFPLDLWWVAFDKKFPGAYGHIALSSIGYNRNFTKAILDVGVSCGGLCGQGAILLLELVQGKWVVSRTQRTWIS